MKRFAVILLLAAAAQAFSATPDSLRRETPDRWLARDKAQHLAVGFWMTGAAYAGARRLVSLSDGKSLSLAVSLSVTAGLAKEAVDRFIGRRRFSWKDLAATVLGISLGILVFSGWS